MFDSAVGSARLPLSFANDHRGNDNDKGFSQLQRAPLSNATPPPAPISVALLRPRHVVVPLSSALRCPFGGRFLRADGRSWLCDCSAPPEPQKQPKRPSWCSRQESTRRCGASCELLPRKSSELFGFATRTCKQAQHTLGGRSGERKYLFVGQRGV